MRNISRKMKCKFLIPFAVGAFTALLSPPLASAAAILGDELASFAVLGATGVTTDPPSTIGGNLGSATTPSITGGYIFTSGSFQPNTGLAQLAQTQLDAAISAVNAGGGIDIGSSLDGWQSTHGGVITPGVYDVSADPTANLLGTLVLDGLGDSNAVWRFRFSSTLVTSEGSDVTVQGVDGGANVGIYWTVGSAATLDGDTFAGNVLANQLISSNGGLTIDCGRLLSATAQVTLIKDKISITGCAGDTGNTGNTGNTVNSGGFAQGVDIGTGGEGGSSGKVVNGAPVPEPGTMMLLGSGLVGLVGWGRKKLRK